MSRWSHHYPDDPQGAWDSLIDRADHARKEARENGTAQPVTLAGLPDCIAELERLLEDRNPDSKHRCGALYQSSRRIRHKIVLWEPGRSDKQFIGETFDAVYRDAYEHIQRDEVAECNIAIGLTPAGCYAEPPGAAE